MKSHEVLRAVLKPHGLKKIAAELKLSRSIVEKWSRPHRNGQSAERNPLDRLVILFRTTGDARLVRWLCAQAGGFFVPNPEAGRTAARPVDLARMEHSLQKQIGELEVALMEVLEQPGVRSNVERLRSRWDVVKTTGEQLVRELERQAGRQLGLAWLAQFYPFWEALTPGGLV